MSPSEQRPSIPPPVATSTAERIAKIVEAAERAASAVIDDAEAQARRYLEEAQAEADKIVAERLSSLGELSDSLVTQAEAIRRQADRLLSSIGDAERAVGSPPTADLTSLRSTPPAAAPPPMPEAPPASPPPVSGPPRLSAVEAAPRGPQPVADPGSAPGAARLLATQMAVSGATREEIDARLRSGFQIEDTAPILDAILGPER